MPACQPPQTVSPVPVTDPCAQELGAVLRSSRLEQGLSLRALAKRVGLSAHSGVAEYERGTRVPPADLIDAYERALGLPSGYLMNLRRQILRDVCGHTYRVWTGSGFDYSKATCPYSGGSLYDTLNRPTDYPHDQCSRDFTGCTLRFGRWSGLPAWFFPGVGKVK